MLNINGTIHRSKFGVYEEGCGLDNVVMSWGHDGTYDITNKRQCRDFASLTVTCLHYIYILLG